MLFKNKQLEFFPNQFNKINWGIKRNEMKTTFKLEIKSNILKKKHNIIKQKRLTKKLTIKLKWT